MQLSHKAIGILSRGQASDTPQCSQTARLMSNSMLYLFGHKTFVRLKATCSQSVVERHPAKWREAKTPGTSSLTTPWMHSAGSLIVLYMDKCKGKGGWILFFSLKTCLYRWDTEEDLVGLGDKVLTRSEMYYYSRKVMTYIRYAADRNNNSLYSQWLHAL